MRESTHTHAHMYMYILREREREEKRERFNLRKNRHRVNSAWRVSLSNQCDHQTKRFLHGRYISLFNCVGYDELDDIVFRIFREGPPCLYLLVWWSNTREAESTWTIDCMFMLPNFSLHLLYEWYWALFVDKYSKLFHIYIYMIEHYRYSLPKTQLY